MLQVSRPENERAKILSAAKFLQLGRDAEFSRKYAISMPLRLQNQQIRFADANRPPHGNSEVTRRDGLSSWRVIFFVTAGMLSGK